MEMPEFSLMLCFREIGPLNLGTPPPKKKVLYLYSHPDTYLPILRQSLGHLPSAVHGLVLSTPAPELGSAEGWLQLVHTVLRSVDGARSWLSQCDGQKRGSV